VKKDFSTVDPALGQALGCVVTAR